MRPTQTSGRDSFGWRLRCPFSLSADPQQAAQRTVMASKTAAAAKSKAKQPAPKKPPEKPKTAAKAAAPAKVVPVKPGAKPAGKLTPAEAQAAKLKAGTGKPPVSNVEAIKAVAIKAAAKGAVPAAAAADKDAGETTDSPLLDLSD